MGTNRHGLDVSCRSRAPSAPRSVVLTTEASKVFSFDDVKVEPRTCEVFRAGAAVALEPKVFKLLVFLIENRDRLVEKEEILDVLWKDVNVTENALASAIAKLRRTLGDDSKTGKYIQTLHARGYRFVADVEVENGSARDGQTETALGDSGGEEGAASLQATPTVATYVGLQDKAQPLPALGKLPSARSLIIAGIACVLLLGAGFYGSFLFERKASGAAGATTSIAVLPFQSAGSSGDDQILGFEIADTLTAKLGSSTHLSVRPTSTMLHYSDLRDDPVAAGRAL